MKRNVTLAVVTKGDDGYRELSDNLGNSITAGRTPFIERDGFSAFIERRDQRLVQLLGQ